MSKAPHVWKGDKYKNDRQDVEVLPSEALHAEAGCAISFVEKWGMVAAMPDGEDSSGRAKLRLATPQETVDRACQMADLMSEQIRARGWVTDVPNPYDNDLAEADKA